MPSQTPFLVLPHLWPLNFGEPKALSPDLFFIFPHTWGGLIWAWGFKHYLSLMTSKFISLDQTSSELQSYIASSLHIFIEMTNGPLKLNTSKTTQYWFCLRPALPNCSKQELHPCICSGILNGLLSFLLIPHAVHQRILSALPWNYCILKIWLCYQLSIWHKGPLSFPK